MSNIIFSANDPGGANAIAPVIEVLKERGETMLGLSSGPANAIFAARGIAVTEVDGYSNEELAAKAEAFAPDVILAGTGAGATADKTLRAQLKAKVPSVCVLDFWGNYWQRFSSEGIKDFAYLPDCICVMDSTAKEEMIAEGFQSELLVVTGNPHFDIFTNGIESGNEDARRILFVSQPISVTAALSGFTKNSYTEKEVLADLADVLKKLPESYELSIRLHPKDDPHVYESYLSKRVTIATEATLEEALSRSGLVVGMSSPVLLQAAAAGKKVLSYQPNLSGKDMLLSNRLGVTRSVTTKEDLAAVLGEYAEGKWQWQGKPFREVWPEGAASRVAERIVQLAKNS